MFISYIILGDLYSIFMREMNQCKQLFPNTYRPSANQHAILRSFTFMIEAPTKSTNEMLVFKIQKANNDISYIEI